MGHHAKYQASHQPDAVLNWDGRPGTLTTAKVYLATHSSILLIFISVWESNAIRHRQCLQYINYTFTV